MLKKMIAVFLCITLCLGSVSVCASAFGPDMDDPFEDALFDADAGLDIADSGGAMTTDRMIEQIFSMTNNMAFRQEMADHTAALSAANSWMSTASAVFGVVKNISSIIGLVNGVINLLKFFGVIKDHSMDVQASILDGVYALQDTVESIDKKVDRIQETLIDEFSSVNMKFAEQEYNHYKDEVWTNFYTNAASPLIALQNEYMDEVNWLIISRAEEWFDYEGSDVRVLYGEDAEGKKMQVYSGTNLGDLGKALPREPGTSIEGIAVTDRIVLPAEYVSVNMNPSVNLSVDNCIEVLHDAFEGGVYEAAENHTLVASDAFYANWETLSAKDKNTLSSQLADELINAVTFAASYAAANERKFASSVRSAYDYFCKWLNSSDSLTSPMYAQLKMLSLTHGFEGEIADEAETIYLYLDLMNINFGSFAETILSLSKAHTLENCEAVKRSLAVSSYNLYKTCTNFLTDNPNYCYMVNKPLQYRSVSLESVTNINLNTSKISSVQSWTLRDNSAAYSENGEERARQTEERTKVLNSNLVSSENMKLLYLMYISQVKRGLTDCGSFLDYLIENRVIASCPAEKYPYGLSTQLVTSYETETLNMTNGGLMNFCGAPTTLTPEDGEPYNSVVAYFVKDEAFVRKGSVPRGWLGELDDVKFADKAVGSTVNLLNGEVDENTYLAARAVNLPNDDPEGLNFPSIFAYCDKFSFDVKHTVDNRVVINSDTTLEKHFGAIVTTDLSVYEFPVDTKEIESNFFGDSHGFNKIVLYSMPEVIAEDAFAGVGRENKRCYLELPADADVGDLTEKWHGGWFGDEQITLYKNDGSGESIVSAQPSDMLCSDIECPFTAPAGMEFAGWGVTANSPKSDCGTFKVSERAGVFAMWHANHEHKFVTSDLAPTCTENGTRGRRVCSICGYVGSSGDVVPALGHNIQNEIGENVCSRCGKTVRIVTYGPFLVTGSSMDGVDAQADSSGNYTLTLGKSGSFTVKNTNPSAEANASIVLAENTNIDLILAGVKINSTGRNCAALEVCGGSDTNVVLTLAAGTENSLKSADGFAGLQKDSTAGTLTIEGSGTLRATGGANAAGIGGAAGAVTGRITVNSGSIYAYGGANGAGIGGGKDGTMHGFTVNGGFITAQGGENYPAIGSNSPIMSGVGFDDSYRINAGVITALAGKNCPEGIGAYYELSKEMFFDHSRVYVSPEASVYVSHTGNSPSFRYDGKMVVPQTISNPNGKTIVIDGNVFPYKTHFDEKCVYPYLTDTDHDIKFANRIDIDKAVENGTISVPGGYAESGEIVTLTAQPDAGYHLAEWKVSPSVTVDGNTFRMPDSDVTVSAVFEKNSHTVRWIAEGMTAVAKYLCGDAIQVMNAPEKEGFRFTSWAPAVPAVMPDEDIEFFAVYAPINYIAKFVVDGKVIGTRSYTVENDSITSPEIPAKPGYVASWEDYTIRAGGITINAEYVPEIYLAKFVADGKVIDEIPYTVETESIIPPVIPNKDGYTAQWSDYTLSPGGITVKAVYTACVHEHTFAAKYSYNEYMHWYPSTCGHEDVAKGLGEHTFGEGIKAGNATVYVCEECSYVKIVRDELAEMRTQAIAQLESAAGTGRSAAMQSAVDLAETAIERACNAQEIEDAKKSGLAVIHACEFAIGNCTVNGGFIYGVGPLLTESVFSEKFIVNDTVSVQYSPASEGILGTGSTVQVTYYNGSTDKYALVIFGDVNGDGVYDGTDAFTVSFLANGMLTKEQVGEAVYMAADCNHDGVIDRQDVKLLEQAGLLLAQVDQSKSEKELLETSSAYMEYIELINQNVEPDPTEPAEDEPVDPFFAVSFLDMLFRIIMKIIALLKSAFAVF